jgi:hypothetical protein
MLEAHGVSVDAVNRLPSYNFDHHGPLAGTRRHEREHPATAIRVVIVAL